MEKNRASCDISHTSFFDSGTNPDFHYSIHENSVLFKSKKMKKLMNRRVEIQSNPCGGCINPSPPSKSPSILKKISNLFCCYVPIKKKAVIKKENLEKTADKKNIESPNTINMLNSGSSDQNPMIIDVAPKEVSQMDLSDDCNMGSEINYFADSKKQSPISNPKMQKCKSGTGSMQSKCPFLKKSYLAAKVSSYPENELFFWKNNEHFVIAKIKHNDFYTDDNNLNENDNGKAKVCNNLSFSLAPNEKKLAFKEHLSSLDTIKPRFKYSVINMAEEVKPGDKENLTYDERFRNSRPKNPNFLKTQNVFEKKIKIDSESWEYTIPEKVSSYLAKRCQLHNAETVLDAYCGIGMNAITFYQEGFEVIAMDSRMIVSTKRKIPSVEYAHYNAALHGINDGIHFIKGEFLDINLTKMMIDVVLINPVLKYCPEKKFSLLKNSSFDYQAVLKKALGMVESVVLCLPRYVEILEIVELFSTVCNENDSEMNCIIEVEFQFINKELQQILVFYGPVAGIGRKEVVDFLMNTVNKDNKTCKLKQNNFIQSIFSRIGIKASAKYIVSAEATKQVNSETILQRFLDLVKLNRELSMEDLDDCRKETEIAEKKEILIKEEKYRDMTLREQCLMLNVNEQNNEKKKFQNVMSTSTSNMFEMSYENYLDLPRSKILKGQEQINETPTISFYSGKLMSSQNTFNCTSLRDKEKNEPKEFHYEYSFQKNPIVPPENTKQEKKINSDPKNQDFDFWGPTNYEMGFTNHLKGKKNEGGKFPDFKCQFFDIV